MEKNVKINPILLMKSIIVSKSFEKTPSLTIELSSHDYMDIKNISKYLGVVEGFVLNVLIPEGMPFKKRKCGYFFHKNEIDSWIKKNVLLFKSYGYQSFFPWEKNMVSTPKLHHSNN